MKGFSLTVTVLGAITLIEVLGLAAYRQRLCVRAQVSRIRLTHPITPRFSIQRIPTPGGKIYHGGADINNRGQIVGAIITTDCGLQAFLWENGRFSRLGTLGGISSSAWAINDSGQIVGRSDSLYGQHAFLWKHGVMCDLGVLPGFTESVATGINNSGQIVGRVSRHTHGPYWTWPQHAVMWKNGRMIDLGVPVGCLNSQAAAINDSGQVVGRAVDRNERTHAILWNHGEIIDLGRIAGYAISSAARINNRGEVIGTVGQSAGTMRTVVWKRDATGHYCYRMLTPLPFHTDSVGATITDNGVAYANAKVGWEYVPAVMWDRDAAYDEPRELQMLLPSNTNWYVRSIFAANSRGQMLVFAYYRDEEEGLAVLTSQSNVAL